MKPTQSHIASVAKDTTPPPCNMVMVNVTTGSTAIAFRQFHFANLAKANGHQPCIFPISKTIDTFSVALLSALLDFYVMLRLRCSPQCGDSNVSLKQLAVHFACLSCFRPLIPKRLRNRIWTYKAIDSKIINRHALLHSALARRSSGDMGLPPHVTDFNRLSRVMQALKHKWTGVTLSSKTPGKPYRAWFRVPNSRELFWLGRYATPQEAMLVADFARYMLRGIDSAKWSGGDRHYPPRAPNGQPCGNQTLVESIVPVAVIYGKLFRYGHLSAEGFRQRYQDYLDFASNLSTPHSRASGYLSGQGPPLRWTAPQFQATMPETLSPPASLSDLIAQSPAGTSRCCYPSRCAGSGRYPSSRRTRCTANPSG